MKVLVTGINGFIGGHLANKFASMGHDVTGMDKTARSGGFRTYGVDMLEEDLKPVLKETAPELILHCAGLASVPFSVLNPETDFQANTWMVYRLLNAMRESGAEGCRFVFMSSAAVYGQPSKLPISENDDLQPISPYALHKKMAEDICRYFISRHSFDIRVLRIFSAYGSGLKKQLFWDLHQKAVQTGELELFGTGSESRDFIHISDLSEAVYLIAMDKRERHIFWNVANGEETFIGEAARLFAEAAGMGAEKVRFQGQAREGDPANWRADIGRLMALGYKKKVSMREGINGYVNWVRSLRTDI